MSPAPTPTPTPEKLARQMADWTRAAQDMANEYWPREKIEAWLRKRGCDEATLATIVAQVHKGARRHNRKKGLVNLVTGAALCALFVGVIIANGMGAGIALPRFAWVVWPIAGFGLLVYGALQLAFG
jgi:hypothetical protein